MTRARLFVAVERSAAAGLVVLAALLAAHPIFSVDFHWHLALGDVIRTRGSIPRTDLFSAVEPDRPYVQFNWLWDVLASLVHSAGGFRAIRVAQAVLAAASIAALDAIMRRRLSSASLALVYASFVLLMFEDRLRARPDAMTLPLLVAILPLLLTGSRNAGRPTLLYVFGLGVLWSNLHGGTSLLLLLSIGAVALGSLFNRRFVPGSDERVGSALMLSGAAIAGVAASPTLIPGLLDWLHAVRPQISIGNEEWQPSYTMLDNGLHPVFVLIGLGPTVVALLYLVEQTIEWRRRGIAGADFAEWFLCAGYLVLAHHAVRNAFLCALPLAFMLQRRARSRLNRSATVIYALAALALALATFDDAIVRGYGGIARAAELSHEDLSPGAYPVELADFVAEAGIQGGVLNDGRWGGYLIWRTWPACGIFADTRHHFTPEMWKVFLVAHRPLERHVASEIAFRRWGVELLAFPAPTFALPSPPPDHQLLYKAGDQELYQRVSGMHAAVNFQRAAAWARARGEEPGAPGTADFARAMTRVGAQRWLAAPQQRRRLATALEALEATDPADRARGHRGRGRLWLDAGDYDKALSEFDAALAIDPRDARARYQALWAQLALGRDAAARATLHELGARQAGGLPPDAPARIMLARRFLSQ